MSSLQPHAVILSVISPVYRGRDTVTRLVAEILTAVEPLHITFEIVLVDDASPDDSWSVIREMARLDPRVAGVRLSRNFGQQHAITAGVRHARGDYLVVLDCDLQDDPKYIPAMLAKARDGFDVVFTEKSRREFGAFRNLLTIGFYWLFRTVGEVKAIDAHVGGYVLISRRVAAKFLEFRDVRRDFQVLLLWLGFRSATVPIKHRRREEGRSTYSYVRLFSHALSLITAHSKTLLTLSITAGFLSVLAALVYASYLIVSYFQHGYRAGWASTMVILLASTGAILMSIGVLGIYVGHIFDQTRGRPLFVVQETINTPDRDDHT